MSGTITHSWNGTILTVTSDSGTSSADLKGDIGIRGAQGVQGEQYKPKKGIDYLTEEEINELLAQANEYTNTYVAENAVGAEEVNTALAEAKEYVEEYVTSNAAPSGYGYGGASIVIKSAVITTEEELTTEIEKIFATMTAGETKMISFVGFPTNSDWRWFGVITKSSANNGSLVAQSAYNSGTEIIKTKYNGTWQPCEWKNPPMHRNVEYRTTERWDGKAVYTQNYYYGYYNSSVTSIEHGISGITNCISIEVINNSYGTFANTNEISLSFTPTTIGITSPWSMGGAFFILKYVK